MSGVLLSPAVRDTDPRRARLRARARALIDRARVDLEVPREAERDALLAEIAAWQAEHVPPFARLCAARGARFDRGPDGWPALPTDVFRFARVSAFEEGADVATFLTSGTTSGARGAHPFVDLALYDEASLAFGEVMLFSPMDGPARTIPFDLVMLAFAPAEHPESSLGYMLGRFAARRARLDAGCRVTWALGDDGVRTDALVTALEAATRDGRPVCMAGTSFAFVFADRALGDRRFALPEESRVMVTGGFKGRTEELSAAELRERVARRYGIPTRAIVSEYGMTELSSQLWGRGVRDAGRGHPDETRELLAWPPWVRVTAVDPETLAPLPEGVRGALRIDDVANLDSCVSIQTADLGEIVRDVEGRASLVLVGRDPSAVPRGCSLAVEDALGSLPLS
ncbi:MAG: coenzyme F390 synthetase [Sandaracinaceae bacterium]